MDKLAEKIAELSDKYGSHTIEAMRGAARVEAYSSLVGGGALLVLGLALLSAALYTYFLVGKKLADENYRDDGAGYYLTCIGLVLLSAGPLLGGTWNLINPWIYATISNPDLWIAKKVLGL